MSDRKKIIYLTGIIDGEGYIGIKKSDYGKRVVGDCRNPTYHERIQVRMIHEGAINLLKEIFGGNYYKESPYNNGRKPLYCYQASDKLAATILKKTLPYLIVKKKQAETVLKLRKSKESKSARLRGSPAKRPMKPKIVEYREKLYQQIKKLNH